MLKILQIVFSIIGISLAAYGLIARDFQLNCLMFFFLGLYMLTSGIQEFRRGKKVYGCFLTGVFLFSMYASIQSFLWM